MSENPIIASAQYYAVDCGSKAAILILAIVIFYCVEPFERNIAWNETDRLKPVLEESVPAWLALLLYVIVAAFYVAFISLSIIVDSKRRAINRTVTFHRLARTALSLVSAIVYCWGIVEPLKRFASAPRPHFLARCYGGVEYVPALEDLPIKITNEMCLQNYINLNRASEITEHILAEDRLSFPSAHSAFTATIFCWMGLSVFFYSHLMGFAGYSSIGGAVLILLACPLGFVATSRIRDLWHFSRDVLGGLSIGVLVAAWQYFSYFPLILHGRTGSKAFFDQNEFKSRDFNQIESEEGYYDS